MYDPLLDGLKQMQDLLAKRLGLPPKPEPWWKRWWRKLRGQSSTTP